MTCYIVNGSQGRIKHDQIMKTIFNSQTTNIEDIALDQQKSSEEDVRFIWSVKNKYYEAKVHVFISNKMISSECRVPPVGAIVYFLDQPNESENAHVNQDSENCLDTWLQSHRSQKRSVQKNGKCSEDTADKNVDKTSPSSDGEDDWDSEEVRLLITEGFSSEITRSKVFSWALDKGVEIVDLSEKDEDDESEETNEKCSASENTAGNIVASQQKRVLEALQTYPWHELTANHEQQEKEQPANECNDLGSVVAAGGAGEFEELMSRLSTFKQASDNLPREERYAFAEQIALSFYSSMGGDDCEDGPVELEEPTKDGSEKT